MVGPGLDPRISSANRTVLLKLFQQFVETGSEKAAGNPTIGLELPSYNGVSGSLLKGDCDAHSRNHDAKREVAGAGG